MTSNQPDTSREPIGANIELADPNNDTVRTALQRVKSTDTGLDPDDGYGILILARMAIAAGVAPPSINTVEKAFIAMAYGREVGMMPMQALATVCVINNKPAMYGNAPLAIVMQSGLLEDISENFEGGDPGGAELTKWPGDYTAVCTVKRKGMRSPKIGTFSVREARNAGLWGQNTWVKYPSDMLRYKARARAMQLFADLLHGFHQAEDLEGEPWDGGVDISAAPPGVQAMHAEAEAVARDTDTSSAAALAARLKKKQEENHPTGDLLYGS